MSFRTRLLLTVAAVALGSLAVLAFGLRREVDTRLSADYARRVAATVSAIEVNLGLEGDEIAEPLAALGRALQRDNRFRLAAVAGVESERRYLLDYAGTAIALTGLSMLQIQDDDGRIVSSGHFRNEHGRPAPALAERLAAEPDGVISSRSVRRTAVSWRSHAAWSSVWAGGASRSSAGWRSMNAFSVVWPVTARWRCRCSIQVWMSRPTRT